MPAKVDDVRFIEDCGRLKGGVESGGDMPAPRKRTAERTADQS